jgi:imidazoleglycerol-phosphate dehydratase/histidinol-phosphatase
MSTPTLFIDRDGTLIEEPPDNQVDELRKVRFLPGVFAALAELTRRGYRLVMVTNQDGLGTEHFPRAAFEACHEFVLEAFRSQGVVFDAVFICPHRESEGCTCRKPRTGLLENYLRQRPIDPERSAVIGDRASDLALANNLEIRGFTVCRDGASDHTWPSVFEALTARHATVIRKTTETRIDVRVNLDRESAPKVFTGIGFFDHMLEQLSKHGGFSLELTANGDLRVDEHHTVEDSGLALGEALRRALREKSGIARYGFVLPMDEAEVAIALDLSGRSFFQFQGRFPRETVGALPTELVPHFFRSLSETLKATLHVSVKGENTHHMVEACFKGVGRALRQAFTREGRDLPSTKGTL